MLLAHYLLQVACLDSRPGDVVSGERVQRDPRTAGLVELAHVLHRSIWELTLFAPGLRKKLSWSHSSRFFGARLPYVRDAPPTSTKLES